MMFAIIFQVITLNPQSMSTHPWSAAYILKRAQCGAPEDLDPVIFKPAELSYQIFSSKYQHTVTQRDGKINGCDS